MSQTTPQVPLKDEDIVELYFARDERAIRETERRWGEACLKLSLHILSSRADAEECVNDTYLKTWNSIPPNRPLSLGAYVLRIARNLSVSRLRSLTAERRNREMTVSMAELADCLPDRTLTEGELSDEFSRFIETLNRRDRRLFLGRYWYNLPVKALAAEWGMTPNAVSQNLGKTREALRAHLQKGGYTV